MSLITLLSDEETGVFLTRVGLETQFPNPFCQENVNDISSVFDLGSYSHH